MKNLSITLLILSSLLFGTSAFAQSKQSKNRKTSVNKTHTVKNVRPNRKVVKVKTVKYKKGKVKHAKQYRPSRKVQYKTHYKPRFKQHQKWKRGSKRYVVGDRYASLPHRAVRVVRHGRVQYYAHNTYFRPVYRYGHNHFVVVF